MTPISEMTDADLRLAIAEVLGWTKGTFGTLRLPWLMPNGTAMEVLPNYPGDVAVALNDLVKYMAEKGYWLSLNHRFIRGNLGLLDLPRIICRGGMADQITKQAMKILPVQFLRPLMRR